MRKSMTRLFTLALMTSLAAGPALADDKKPAGDQPTETKPAPPPEPKKDAPPPDAKKDEPAPPEAKKGAPAKKKKKAPPAADEAPAAAPEGVAAEVKAGTGVAKREPVGEADTFTAGSKVWAWSAITGAKDQTVKFVWKKDGNVIWEKEITVTSARYRTWTRRTVQAGTYTVEVQSGDGAVLGSVEFTVS